MRVVFMSGYTDDAVMHHGVVSSTMAFVQKPLTPEPLLQKVREVLDGRALD
jgi:DNA-binding NarL/FixJ family response regulator